MKKHCDKIERETKSLEERQVEGHFHVVFEDDSERKEHDSNWSSFSTEKVVKYGNSTKTVSVSTLPIKRICIKNDFVETTLDVPVDCEVYQAIRSRAVLALDGAIQKTVLIGRIVGLIKDGSVIEERFLNFLTNEVTGFRL